MVPESKGSNLHGALQVNNIAGTYAIEDNNKTTNFNSKLIFFLWIKSIMVKRVVMCGIRLPFFMNKNSWCFRYITTHMISFVNY
jgi:hypothetical protein